MNKMHIRPEITKQTSDSSGQSKHDEVREKSQPRGGKPKRTISLFWFIIVLALVVLLAALSLGLGLGLGLTRHRTVKIKSTGSNFNYSSFYGIPDTLPVVPSEKLVNQKELDLDTSFIVSDQPQLREFTFNITQALAAPDGTDIPGIM